LAICSVSKLITGYTELTGFYGFSQKKTNKKHLESLLDHSPYQNSFIQCNGNWAQKKWRAYEGGGMPTSFVPAQQYDGILFFKYVSPAYFDVSEKNREE
jgi:erythromycin esterase